MRKVNHTPRASTMKCIRSKADKRIVRVRNDEAAAKIAAGTHTFTTKGAYKAQERNHANVVS